MHRRPRREERIQIPAMQKNWQGNKFKEREVRTAIRSQFGDEMLVDAVFEIVRNQRDY